MTTPALSRRRPVRLAALVALFVAAGFSPAMAQRLALVVGNSTYGAAPLLKNASKDATDVAAALERVGFKVTLLTDVRNADFWTQVDAFAAAAQDAEATVFYYAGHAFQMNGVNYLLPVDARLESREALASETWSLDGIIARLQDRKRQTLIFIDASRKDPLPASVRGTGAADGLARIQTGVGTFVAFAAEPGGVTYDGAGDAPNGPFATALLKSIETPGLSVSDLIITVRNDVSAATGGLQSPWDQSSLRDQFYFLQEAEKKQELSEADYELLAQLPFEERQAFFELLAQSGFSEENLAEAEAAILIAESNLVVAAEAEMVMAVATDAGPAVVEDEGGDLSSLVVVEDDAAPVAVDPSATPEPPVEVAVAEPAPAPQPPVEVAVAEPLPEPPVAVAEPAPAPEPPVEVAEPAPAPKPQPEPEPEIVIALAEPQPEPQPPVSSDPAGVEVLPRARTAEVTQPAGQVPGFFPAEGTAQPAAPAPAGTIASVGEAVLTPLPQPDSAPALGAAAPDLPPPVRIAALSWQTRGIDELFAVAAERETVAGTQLSGDTEENRAILAAIDPTLLSDSVVVDTANLAREAQAELRRLGCYRMKVDGDWGKGSRTALTSYFLSKKQVPTSLEPTVELVARLKTESKVVCEVRVARATVVPGRTRDILTTAAEPAGQTVVKKPKVGRTANTVVETKKQIGKSLLNPGAF